MYKALQDLLQKLCIRLAQDNVPIDEKLLSKCSRSSGVMVMGKKWHAQDAIFYISNGNRGGATSLDNISPLKSGQFCKQVATPHGSIVVYLGPHVQTFQEVFSDAAFVPGLNSWAASVQA